MSSAASKPQPSEAFTCADGPAMLRMWDDLKTRTGLSGTPLVEEGATSWRGTLLGRNRYRFRIDTEAELLEVEVSGRETPMPPRLLFAAELSDAGLAKAVTAICAAEQPEPETVSAVVEGAPCVPAFRTQTGAVAGGR